MVVQAHTSLRAPSLIRERPISKNKSPFSQMKTLSGKRPSNERQVQIQARCQTEDRTSYPADENLRADCHLDAPARHSPAQPGIAMTDVRSLSKRPQIFVLLPCHLEVSYSLGSHVIRIAKAPSNL